MQVHHLILETYGVNILYDVVEFGMRLEASEPFTFVEQCVDEIRVVGQHVGEAGVDDLQHHPNAVLQDSQI